MDLNRKAPVDWNELKQIQDEHAAPRITGSVVIAVFLFGISAFAFLVSIYLALDPEEMVEPARYLLYALASVGLLTGWAGVMCLLHSAPPGSAK